MADHFPHRAGIGSRQPVRLIIRAMDSRDRPAVGRHLLDLDAVDRNARFGGAFSDAAIEAYVLGIDWTRALLAGAVENGRVVGLAEAQPTEMPHRVEIAASVHAPFRRMGLATHLIQNVMSSAFDRGADVAELSFAPGNRAIIGLIRRLGGTFAGLSNAEIKVLPSGCVDPGRVGLVGQLLVRDAESGRDQDFARSGATRIAS
jgi:ribosomal protein S18 acetylase RimI-like enzyme